MVVINGAKNEPVESTEPLKSKCSNPAFLFPTEPVYAYV
jgi:hypothetical protein